MAGKGLVLVASVWLLDVLLLWNEPQNPFLAVARPFTSAVPRFACWWMAKVQSVNNEENLSVNQQNLNSAILNFLLFETIRTLFMIQPSVTGYFMGIVLGILLRGITIQQYLQVNHSFRLSKKRVLSWIICGAMIYWQIYYESLSWNALWLASLLILLLLSNSLVVESMQKVHQWAVIVFVLSDIGRMLLQFYLPTFWRIGFGGGQIFDFWKLVFNIHDEPIAILCCQTTIELLHQASMILLLFASQTAPPATPTKQKPD